MKKVSPISASHAIIPSVFSDKWYQKFLSELQASVHIQHEKAIYALANALLEDETLSGEETKRILKQQGDSAEGRLELPRHRDKLLTRATSRVGSYPESSSGLAIAQ